MKALFVPVGQGPTLIEIPGFNDPSALRARQSKVGGYVERIKLLDSLACWVNEDGRAMGLERNEWVSSLIVLCGGTFSVVGDVLLVGWDSETHNDADIHLAKDELENVIANRIKKLSDFMESLMDEFN